LHTVPLDLTARSGFATAAEVIKDIKMCAALIQLKTKVANVKSKSDRRKIAVQHCRHN
jgi:hypothetical protein